jgi:hypothetical protein
MLEHAIKKVLEDKKNDDIRKTIDRVMQFSPDANTVNMFNIGKVIAKLVADSGPQIATDFINLIKDHFNNKLSKWSKGL